MEPTLAGSTTSSAPSRSFAEANKRALKAGYAFGETTEIFHTALPGEARPPAAGHVPQHHRQRGDGARLRGRVPARRARPVLRLVPDHARQRHPPPALDLQALRGADVPGGGRDRGHRVRHRRGLRRCDGPDRELRPGHRAQDGGARARRDGRAAARRRRRPARRSQHRHAHQDRAVGPAPGHVRSQRRGPGAGRRAGHARRVLRLRHRGVAHRAQVHDPRRLPLRRVPGHRLGAVAHPGARRPAQHRGRQLDRPGRRSTPTSATRRRSPGRGPSPARPGSSTASAASRRPTSRATSATTPRTTTG